MKTTFKKIKVIITLLTFTTIIISCSKEEDPITITASDYTSSIEENSVAGTSLGSLSGMASNSAAVTYTISSQVPANAVSIDNLSGELKINAAAAFDYETNPQITGAVTLSTAGATQSVNFTINLIDVVAKKVLVIGSESVQGWLDDVQDKIEATNLFDTVDMHNSRSSLITTATLIQYDAVLVYTNNSPLSARDFGDNLATYIDGGGRVVEATFGGNVSITGNYNSYKVYDTSVNIGQSQGTARTIGTINVANHPIMSGVSTFNGGTSSYYNTNVAVATGATKVVEYDNGEPFIIIKNEVGVKNVPGAFLNFFPPSKDARNDFWDETTDGAKIMANALKFVGNK